MNLKKNTLLNWNLAKSVLRQYRRHSSVQPNQHGVIFEPLVADSATKKPLHVPVMKQEVMEIINPQPGQRIVDMTFGAGGHSKSLLSRGSTVFGLDRDPLAAQIGLQLQSEFPDTFVPLKGKFSQITTLLASKGVYEIDAVLFDFGASSMQFDDKSRGFSLSKDGPLNMRMDKDSNQMTAEDVVNNLDEHALYTIIKKYGEEKQARHVAKAIVDARYAFGRIATTKQLADIVAAAIQGGHRLDSLKRHSHPATKTFQALRIFVNNELNEIYNGLNCVNRLLRPPTSDEEGGVCVCISFHSLEDRIVKRNFNGTNVNEELNMSLAQQHRKVSTPDALDGRQRCPWSGYEDKAGAEKSTSRGRGLTLPREQDVAENPRARSAKLRAARKR